MAISPESINFRSAEYSIFDASSGRTHVINCRQVLQGGGGIGKNQLEKISRGRYNIRNLGKAEEGKINASPPEASQHKFLLQFFHLLICAPGEDEEGGGKLLWGVRRP